MGMRIRQRCKIVTRRLAPLRSAHAQMERTLFCALVCPDAFLKFKTMAETWKESLVT